jgi:hypothetical protein
MSSRKKKEPDFGTMAYIREVSGKLNQKANGRIVFLCPASTIFISFSVFFLI